MPETATLPPPEVQFRGDRLAIRFDRFDIPSYDLFLKAKSIPEYEVEFHEEDESYSITAPSRFAGLLGARRPDPGEGDLPLLEALLDDQKAIVRMALDAKRYACWSDCGLGKTVIGLEVSRHVLHRTRGRGLIVTLNDLVDQWIAEAHKFYGDSLPIHRIKTRQGMRDWCRDGEPGLAITNYEKWNPESLAQQVVSEAKYLSLIVLDESDRLRTGGGKQKWAIIKSSRGIEYKLSLTATPAPNAVMEFASQAAFLEKMRSQGEILWTYFTRDSKTHRWTVRPHARDAFFRFMSDWSIYVRDPKRYGWRLGMAEVPPPEMLVHEIEPTTEQLDHLADLSTSPDGQRSFLDRDETNAIQRMKLSQIARGFRYRHEGKRKKVERVPSRKPPFVADLIRSEVGDGLQVLVWTVFDAESTILAELLGRDVRFDLITGSTKRPDRVAALDRFRSGESRVLISRATMLGYGMNFQCAGSMVFSGFNDSYVAFYQAIHRAYRFGQTRRVRVHLPYIAALEGDMYDNLILKQDEHEASIAEMERNYIEATRALRGGY